MAPATIPAPTPASSTSSASPAAPSEPDRYPAELVGRPFEIQSASSPGTIVLGRIGLPERLRLPAGEFKVAIAGDLVLTSLDNDAAAKLSIWSFSTGTRVLEPIDAPTLSWPTGSVAGGAIIAMSTQAPEGMVASLVRVSLPDGGITELVEASKPTGFTNPFRGFVVSRDGSVAATTICSSGVDFVGGCDKTKLIRTDDGAVIASIDLEGGSPIELTNDGVLVGFPDHFEWRSLHGSLRWSSARYVDTYFLQGVWLLDDHTVLATVFVVGDPSVRRVLAFDLESGERRTIADLRTVEEEREPPSVAAELSTPRSLAIGFSLTNCGPIGNLCEPDERPIIDADLLDLATGQITPHAIHITLTE